MDEHGTDPQEAADVALLRQQLKFIGDALAEVPAEERAPARPRRGRRLTLALAASTAVVTLGVGAMYLAAHNGRPDGGADLLLTPEGVMACSTVIAEGTVVSVEPAGGDRKFSIVLDVDRYYKPRSGGGPRTVFTAEGSGTEGYFKPGTRMLVLVSRFPGEGPHTFREGDPAYTEDTGEDTSERTNNARDDLEWGRKWVEEALPGAEGSECPGPG